MRFYNFNTKINEWKTWYKNFIIPLNNKILSLINYIRMFNPPYLILNPDNRKSDQNINIDQYKQEIIVDDEYSFLIFFITELNFREGINNIYSDHGLLGEPHYTNNVLTSISLLGQNSGCTFSKNNQGKWVSTDSPKTLKKEFLVGTTCFLNKLPMNLAEKQKVWNYIFLPTHSGSYYDFNQQGNNLLSQLKAINNFNMSNSVLVNLSFSNLFYTYEANFKNNSSISIYNYDVRQNKPLITDINGNFWTGDSIIIHENKAPFGEEIYLDEENFIEEEEENRHIIYSYNIKKMNPFPMDYMVRLY